MNIIATAFWRRLDQPGHDACRLVQTARGWEIDGTAVFAQDGITSAFDYQVVTDGRWHALRARVRGWHDADETELEITRRGSDWSIHGTTDRSLRGCEDIDLGFTPATNLLTIRRLGLSVGETGDTHSVWLDGLTGRAERLAQSYERTSDRTYWYEAPRFGYSASIEVDSSGFVIHYPGLWVAELVETTARR